MSLMAESAGQSWQQKARRSMRGSVMAGVILSPGLDDILAQLRIDEVAEILGNDDIIVAVADESSCSSLAG
jgi:hypothetical protein